MEQILLRMVPPPSVLFPSMLCVSSHPLLHVACIRRPPKLLYQGIRWRKNQMSVAPIGRQVNRLVPVEVANACAPCRCDRRNNEVVRATGCGRSVKTEFCRIHSVGGVRCTEI